MRIVGNQETWLRFGRERPTAALLSGPAGVGRFTNATLIAGAFTKELLTLDSFLVKDAEELLAFLSTTPRTRKIAVVNPTKASAAAWSRILTVLESLPPSCHVWFVDNGAVPMAVRTRCVRYDFDFLSSDELRRIMPVDEDGVQPFDWNSGSYDAAEASKLAMSGISSVVAWIRSIENGSREELLRCVQGWQLPNTSLLREELDEQFQGRSKLTYPWSRVKRLSILNAIELLECPDARLGAVTAGMFLLEAS